MIKVVYFDDSSATDYLNIYDGGTLVQEENKIKDKSKELLNQSSANLFARLSWLPFLGGSAETTASADFSYNTSSLLKTTLSNTVLTDFLKKASKDERRIIKFIGYRVNAHKNSIAFFKMFTPYLKIAESNGQDDGFDFNLSRMDEAFESAKGYYELVAKKDSTKDKIFRFNISAFRNNYGIADLSKMQLSFYGVKVGESDVNLLDIKKEFNFEQGDITSAYEIEDESKKRDELDVYDIILAGIEI